MERLIADANKVKEANGEMADLSIDSFADVTEAIHIIQTEMGITGTTAKEADETITGSFNSMKASWENLMVAMADPDANMSTVIDQFIESVQTFGENLIPIVEEALLGVAELVNTLLPPILNTLPTLLNELLPVIIQSGANLLTALVNGISANMETLVPTILNCIMIIANTILDNLPMILELGMELIIQLMLGIAEQAPELVPQIVDIIIKMLEVFNEHFDEFLMAGVQLILGLIKGLINSIPTIVKNLPTILMAMINFFTASKLISAGTSLIRGLGTGLINGIPNLIKNIPTIIKNLINSFKTNGLGAFKDIGTQLIKGLWSGISSAKDWLIDKIGGFTSSVVDAFKDFFGIHSPSRLMKDEVGKFVAQGVGAGFEDEIDNVYKDMQKTIDFETEKMSANVQTGNIYNKVMNTTPVQVNGSYTSRLEVNGEVLAEVVNDVNDKKDLQYMF